MFVSVQELVIKDDFPLSVNTFPATMTHELCLQFLLASVFACEILERVR
jgi:hypothetical protein